MQLWEKSEHKKPKFDFNIESDHVKFKQILRNQKLEKGKF